MVNFIKFFVRRVLIASVLFILLLQPLYGQSLKKEIPLSRELNSIKKPGQLTLSASRSKIAVADILTNKIYVFDSHGELLWEVGDNVKIEQPLSVCFDDENVLYFTLKKSRFVYRVYEKNPDLIDTLKAVTTKLNLPVFIIQILKDRDGNYLVLDDNNHEVLFFNKEWQFKKVLIKYGQGKGRVLFPSQLAQDFSGNLIITDQHNVPLQFFSAEGKFLFYAGWNKPGTYEGWGATAVAVDNQQIIWVTDVTNRQFRLYNATGNEVGKIPFILDLINPLSMVVTASNELIVSDENHGVFFYAID
ncbi:MAG: hypothetical protein GXO93_04015 [FCB group bacterium]|nr:hypothetical protein [FCB group bacterium]